MLRFWIDQASLRMSLLSPLEVNILFCAGTPHWMMVVRRLPITSSRRRTRAQRTGPRSAATALLHSSRFAIYVSISSMSSVSMPKTSTECLIQDNLVLLLPNIRSIFQLSQEPRLVWKPLKTLSPLPGLSRLATVVRQSLTTLLRSVSPLKVAGPRYSRVRSRIWCARLRDLLKTGNTSSVWPLLTQLDRVHSAQHRIQLWLLLRSLLRRLLPTLVCVTSWLSLRIRSRSSCRTLLLRDQTPSGWSMVTKSQETIELNFTLTTMRLSSRMITPSAWILEATPSIWSIALVRTLLPAVCWLLTSQHHQLDHLRLRKLRPNLVL
uniref:(northern house mosquito) hypothetical protein n=1 Tax=Culex pipiens TaxID=7175 RepID=A0A8D8JZD4_CULPI